MNKYSKAFSDAMDRTGIRNTVVAAHLGKVGNNSIAQWRTGRRPIPAEHAPKVAALLGVLPESISESYERLLRCGAILADTPGPGSRNAPPAGHLVLEQLEDFGRQEEHPRIWLPESIAKRKLGLTPADHVRWTLQPSWSMAPEIERHTTMLIDITTNALDEAVDGGLYAYTLWGRPDIRRTSMRKGVLTLTGANQDIERIIIDEQELEQFHLCGAVIGWI